MLPTLAIVANTTAKFVLAWVLLYCFWRSYRTDALRQKLFALRDELFDLACDSQLAFEDPAYWRLRRTLNSMIRFAHRLSFTRLVVTILGTAGLRDEGAYGKWKSALDAVESDELKGKIKQIHRRMVSMVSWHIVRGCPLLWVLLSGVLLVATVFALLSGAAKVVGAIDLVVTKRVSVLEDEAVRRTYLKTA